MLSVILTRYSVSTITPAPAVPALERSTLTLPSEQTRIEKSSPHQTMTTIPILYVIFSIAVMFQPADTSSFTISYADQTMTWTADDTGWNGTMGDHNLGHWVMDGFNIAIKSDSETNNVDLKDVFKGSAREKNKLVIYGQEVTIDRSKTVATFSQSSGGILSDSIKVKYTAKANK